MKNQLLLLLSILTLIFNSCSKDENSIVTEENSVTTEETNIPNDNENNTETKLSTLNIKLSGRTVYDEIYVSIRLGENNNLLEALEKVNNDGTISFNVEPYINQNLTVKVHEKIGDVTPVLDGTTQIKTILENENNLTINIPLANVYEAKIKITTDGVAKQGVTVYAIDSFLFSGLKPLIERQGSSIFTDVENEVTNSEGFVEFKNLNVLSGTKYHFVIITKEPTSAISLDGRYEEIIINLDGKLKEGTINIESELTGTVSIDLSDISKTGILVEVYDENENIVYSKTSTSSTVNITDIALGTYDIFASKLSECVFAEQKTRIIVSENQNNPVIIKFRKSLKLINESNNPYTVTITDSKNSETVSIIEGNSEKEFNLPPGVTKINVKQNSGFIFFATENDFIITLDCNQKSEQSFPE